MHTDYHVLVHQIAHFLGHQIGEQTPAWLHPFLHIVLFWGPLALLAVLIASASIYVKKRRKIGRPIKVARPSIHGFATNIYSYILVYSKRDQFALMMMGLIAMPVLYLTLELPKIIINDVIESGHFPIDQLGYSLNQEEYLFVLSMLFLAAIFTNGALKLFINIYKGRVGERLLRRLRLTIYRKWLAGAGSDKRTELIPVVTQEVEPIGGFASDAFALPVFQGGTFVTILVFMFIQDPILGAAAITLLPVQLAVIPKLQHRVNLLARERVAEIRRLGGELGDQAILAEKENSRFREVGGSLKRIEIIRRRIHRTKFLMKALNNFLSALTPFFFYSIGGYLVIEGDLSLGSLVAILAAYKDFSAPLRELFRYYQSAEDVRIRYSEVLNYVSGRSEYVVAQES